jgi:hypothetical protein
MSVSRSLAAMGIAWAALAWCGSTAMAQGGGPGNLQYTPRPTVSPYLNLFNSNANTLGNYQLNVKPLLDQYNINSQNAASLNQLQQQLNEVRTSTGLGTNGTSGRIRPTGHVSGFMDLSHYYLGRSR